MSNSPTDLMCCLGHDVLLELADEVARGEIVDDDVDVMTVVRSGSSDTDLTASLPHELREVAGPHASCTGDRQTILYRQS